MIRAVASGSLAVAIISGCSKPQPQDVTLAEIKARPRGAMGHDRVICDLNSTPDKTTPRQRETIAEIPSAAREVRFLRPNLDLQLEMLEGKPATREWRLYTSPLYDLTGDERLLGETPDVLTVDSDSAGMAQIGRTDLGWTNARKQHFRFEFVVTDVSRQMFATLSRWNTADAAEADFVVTGSCKPFGGGTNLYTQRAIH